MTSHASPAQASIRQHTHVPTQGEAAFVLAVGSPGDGDLERASE